MEKPNNFKQEGTTNSVVYPSKVGLELLIPFILIFGIGIVVSFEKSSLTEVIVQFGIMFAFVALFFSISYEVTDDVLTVTTFFFIKKSVPIKDITRIVESNNPLSSPAASLDRLEVYYGKYSSTVISPKDKMNFIEHLKRLSPSIQVELKKKNKGGL
ncbi:PH domain-containing protein [Muricauda sp. 334s03]|uniref:PH domain-containing protein n=1 Tax=Flagellimonas yonaguniensis TaxID=3031325 RepID=A0ABT5XXD5_9FLAO|nr:PH domain-containing protein [[Muricauda] yonaguniensis]MDF0715845.1 PH domain-containing protein [[Muricauda] yonaguniensis]